MATFQPGSDVLEVTLRDGSYLIDFQFTAEDTATIAAALEAAGFRWIEVGHGLGLHASEAGKGHAAASDEEYLAATAEALHTARWGMFFIPGIGRESDLELAVRYKMSFVRVGTDVTQVERAEPFIARAKELGMLVSYNAMKSYAVTPAEFGQAAARVQSWGGDLICLVDSAGGMIPDEVSVYFQAARDVSDIPLGFHGHDNLSLSAANSLRAVELGAALVDSSLQGMGRSAGNATTERLVAILKKRGELPHIDLMATMDIGSGLIRPLMQNRGYDPLAITSGYACFHSSFAPKVRQYAEKHGIDPRDLIVRLCEEDQVNAPDDLLERLSHELAAAKMPRVISIPAFGLVHRKNVHGMDALPALGRALRARAVKAGQFSALNVVLSDRPLAEVSVSGNIQTMTAHTMGSVTVGSSAQLSSVLEAVDGAVDIILLDVDRKSAFAESPGRLARACLKQSRLLTYSDDRIWLDAVENQIVRLLEEVVDGVPIVIAGDHPRSRRLALRLADRGAQVALVCDPGRTRSTADPLAYLAHEAARLPVATLDSDAPELTDWLQRAHLVAAWPREEAWFGSEYVAKLSPETYLIDAGIGSLMPEALDVIWRHGARLIRVNIWPALSGALEQAHESARVCEEALGWSELGGIPVVAGGAIGRDGDIIVDSVNNPTRVIGLADGRGGVVFDYDKQGAARVRRVIEEIHRRLLSPLE